MALALPHADDKARVVRAMFDRIAPSYDRLNRVLTWRLDQRWRRAAIAAARLGPGDVAVDVACGTGDLAELATATGARVLGIDFAPVMLAMARRRGIAATFVRADAAALPLGPATADALTCGFALRNFAAIPPVLAEAARVLRPGGRLVLLEVGTPTHPVLRWLHHAYFARVVPFVGGLLADRWAYGYLPASVAYLPPTATLLDMVRDAGFVAVDARSLFTGAAQLVTATRGTP